MFRYILGIALAGAAVGTPVAAHERAATRGLDTLQNPATQDALANAIGSLTAALMQLRVAPFINAMNDIDTQHGHRAVAPDATVADLMGRDGDAVTAQANQHARTAARATGAMAGALQQMLPQLEQMAEQLGNSIDVDGIAPTASSPTAPHGAAQDAAQSGD